MKDNRIKDEKKLSGKALPQNQKPAIEEKIYNIFQSGKKIL